MTDDYLEQLYSLVTQTTLLYISPESTLVPNIQQYNTIGLKFFNSMCTFRTWLCGIVLRFILLSCALLTLHPSFQPGRSSRDNHVCNHRLRGRPWLLDACAGYGKKVKELNQDHMHQGKVAHKPDLKARARQEKHRPQGKYTFYTVNTTRTCILHW